MTTTPDGRIVSIGIPAVFDKHWRDEGRRPLMRASVLDPGAKKWRMIPAGDLLLDTDGGQVWGPAGGLVVKPDAGTLSDRRPNGRARKHPTGGMLDPVSGTWIPLPPQPKPAPGTIPFEAAAGWGGDFAISHGWALDVPHRRWYEVPQPIPGLDGMTGTSVVWTGHSLFAWGGDLTAETLFAPERLRGWIWTPTPDDSHTSGPSDP